MTPSQRVFNFASGPAVLPEPVLRQLLAIPGHYRVLFMQGGGHQQFAMVPINLLGAKLHAEDIPSGHLPACRH